MNQLILIFSLRPNYSILIIFQSESIYLLKVVMKPHVDLGVHVQQHVILQARRSEIVLILFVVQQKNKDHVLDLVSVLSISWLEISYSF